MVENDLPEQLRIRREKRNALLDRGVAPYPVRVPRTASLKEIRERFKDLETDKSSGVTESVTGRIIFKRDTGKLCFATLREGEGTEPPRPIGHLGLGLASGCLGCVPPSR